MEPMVEVNPKGYWEDMEIYQLNEEMLQALGTQWYHSTPLLSGQIDTLVSQGFAERATVLLQSKHLDGVAFAFKDPRLCRLLEFWQRILAHTGGRVGYVLALRNPASIADSLQKRDGLDRTQSYLLWLTHTLNSVLLTNGQPRVLVDYDKMLQEPEKQWPRIAEYLHLSVQHSSLSDYAEDFLDQRLRHHCHTATDLQQDPACPDMVFKCYRDLMAVARDRKSLDTPAIQKRFQRTWKDLQSLRSVTQAMDRLIDGNR